MRKALFITGLCLSLCGVSFARESSSTGAASDVMVRVAIVRNGVSLDKTMKSVFEGEYDGVVRIIRDQDGRFVAVNTLSVEDFLKGVVGREMSPSWPIEALKAQAVAARSHALYQAEQSFNAPFDLIANFSQAYQGVDRRSDRVAESVDQTRNQVIVFNNVLVPAFFHTSCGGHTASAEWVWRSPGQKRASTVELPRSVVCRECASSSSFQWVADVTMSELSRKMTTGGFHIGNLASVEVLGHTPSGRASRIKLTGSTGVETITAEKLRAILGYNVLKSGFFEIESGSHGVVFRGEGWGHGVGLCQFGAKQMAEKGASYREILEYYFPGSRIVSYQPPEQTALLKKR